MDDAPYATPKELHIEGNEEPQGKSSGFQVGEDLRDVDGRELLDGFQLDHELLFYEEVQPSFADSVALVSHGDRDLSGKPNASVRQLDAKRLLVNGLQEPRAQQPVHL